MHEVVDLRHNPFLLAMTARQFFVQISNLNLMAKALDLFRPIFAEIISNGFIYDRYYMSILPFRDGKSCLQNNRSLKPFTKDPFFDIIKEINSNFNIISKVQTDMNKSLNFEPVNRKELVNNFNMIDFIKINIW